jgi:predicted nucleotidyltransferase
MRLSEFEKNSIKNIIHSYDPDSEIFIFGSRTDLSKKGGDIDILVMSGKITDSDRRHIKIKLYDTIGEQKIDLLIAKDLSDNFVKHAYESGVKL